eukprot:gene17251-biopygen42904
MMTAPSAPSPCSSAVRVFADAASCALSYRPRAALPCVVYKRGLLRHCFAPVSRAASRTAVPRRCVASFLAAIRLSLLHAVRCTYRALYVRCMYEHRGSRLNGDSSASSAHRRLICKPSGECFHPPCFWDQVPTVQPFHDADFACPCPRSFDDVCFMTNLDRCYVSPVLSSGPAFGRRCATSLPAVCTGACHLEHAFVCHYKVQPAHPFSAGHFIHAVVKSSGWALQVSLCMIKTSVVLAGQGVYFSVTAGRACGLLLLAREYQCAVGLAHPGLPVGLASLVGDMNCRAPRRVRPATSLLAAWGWTMHSAQLADQLALHGLGVTVPSTNAERVLSHARRILCDVRQRGGDAYGSCITALMDHGHHATDAAAILSALRDDPEIVAAAQRWRENLQHTCETPSDDDCASAIDDDSEMSNISLDVPAPQNGYHSIGCGSGDASCAKRGGAHTLPLAGMGGGHGVSRGLISNRRCHFALVNDNEYTPAIPRRSLCTLVTAAAASPLLFATAKGRSCAAIRQHSCADLPDAAITECDASPSVVVVHRSDRIRFCRRLIPTGRLILARPQNYVYDPQSALSNRLQYASSVLGCDLDPNILSWLQGMVDSMSPFPRVFRSMHDRLLADAAHAQAHGMHPMQIHLRFTAPPQGSKHDVRTYDLQEASEVARVFTTDDGAPYPFDICIYPHGAGPVAISPLNPQADPMTYVVLFPFGTPGYSIGIV